MLIDIHLVSVEIKSLKNTLSSLMYKDSIQLRSLILPVSKSNALGCLLHYSAMLIGFALSSSFADGYFQMKFQSVVFRSIPERG